MDEYEEQRMKALEEKVKELQEIIFDTAQEDIGLLHRIDTLEREMKGKANYNSQ